MLKKYLTIEEDSENSKGWFQLKISYRRLFAILESVNSDKPIDTIQVDLPKLVWPIMAKKTELLKQDQANPLPQSQPQEQPQSQPQEQPHAQARDPPIGQTKPQSPTPNPLPETPASPDPPTTDTTFDLLEDPTMLSVVREESNPNTPRDQTNSQLQSLKDLKPNSQLQSHQALPKPLPTPVDSLFNLLELMHNKDYATQKTLLDPQERKTITLSGHFQIFSSQSPLLLQDTQIDHLGKIHPISSTDQLFGPFTTSGQIHWASRTLTLKIAYEDQPLEFTYKGALDYGKDSIGGIWNLPIEGDLVRGLLEGGLGVRLGGMGEIGGVFELQDGCNELWDWHDTFERKWSRAEAEKARGVEEVSEALGDRVGGLAGLVGGSLVQHVKARPGYQASQDALEAKYKREQEIVDELQGEKREKLRLERESQAAKMERLKSKLVNHTDQQEEKVRVKEERERARLDRLRQKQEAKMFESEIRRAQK